MTEGLKSAKHIGDSNRIKVIRLNTMREGSLVRARFAKLRVGMTVAQAVKAGVSKFDLFRAIARDRVVLETLKPAGLCGLFVRLNEDFLREKANRRHDPRHAFYNAMLETDTYEAYAAAVRGIRVSVETYRTGPINGNMEIRYARKRGWIADAEQCAPDSLLGHTVEPDQAPEHPAESENTHSLIEAEQLFGVEILEGFEGAAQRRFVEHRRRERRLRRAKLQDALRRNHGHLVCKVPYCGFDFAQRYGALGRNYAQVHHKEQLSKAPKKGKRNTLADLAVVCANCHVMIHVGGACRPLEGLILPKR